jgi:hypothetical protein
VGGGGGEGAGGYIFLICHILHNGPFDLPEIKMCNLLKQ